MKILLIYPPRRDDTYMFPPTSLLYISQAVRAAGHEAEIIDIPYLLEKSHENLSLLNNSLFDYILGKKCDVLGIGGVVSTYFFYDHFVKKFREMKKDIPIVAGGSIGMPIREVWEDNVPVDYLVDGDGEYVIQRLLDYLENKDYAAIENIPGLYYFKNGRYQGNPPELIDPLDSIPFLNYDETDSEYYISELSNWLEFIIPDRSLIKEKRTRFLPLLTSRGCPFSCTFCFHFNKKYRAHSVDYVIENIKFLKTKYGINALYIIDDLFTFDRKRTIELCESIYKANLGVYFMGSGGKPSFVTAEMLESMKKAGFIRFSYGIESGSQKMLDSMQKRTTVKQNLNALSLTEEKGIPCFANMVFGMPGENYETLKETKSFLIKADLSSKRFYAAWATAYPGTPLFDWMRKEGRVNDTRQYLLGVGSIGKYLYNFSELPMDEFRKKVFELRQEVDMEYYLKRRRYWFYFKKLLVKILVKLFFMLNYKIRDRIEPIARMLLTKTRGRTVARSCVEVEKWIQEFTQ